MNNKVTVHAAEGNVLNFEILATFRIEELTKQYVIYTLNDDGISEDVTLLINEYVVENEQPKIVPIPKEEVNLVLTFYNNLRNNI